MAIQIGDLIENKYRLLRLLGTGGWGSVYEGENIRTLHRVAIKVLHREMSAKTDMVERFEREAQAAGKIGSEHIIEVYDLGELQESGDHFMVMEFLDGEDLAARLTRLGSIPPEELAPILAQVLEGLAAAHEAGILHRDLKPENLFLVRTKHGQDFVKILDFGISKFGTVGTASRMTMTGAVMGSPCYMSPEQARGSKEVDLRSDLFSLGVVLFECSTGRLPFEGENFNELLFKIALNDPPDPLSVLPTLDTEFAAIIRKAMSREVETRYQNAREFQTALYEWMDRHGVSRERPHGRKGRTPRQAGMVTPGTVVALTPATSGHGETVALPGSVRALPVRSPPTQRVPGSSTQLSPELVAVMPPSQRASSSRRMLAIGAPLLLVAMVGSGAVLFHKPKASDDVATAGSAPAPATATATPTAPATAIAIASATTATTDGTAASAAATAGTEASPDSSADPTRGAHPTKTAPTAGGTHVTSGRVAARPGTAANGTAAATHATSAAATAPAATAATPAPTATQTPASSDTVEGRRIRTGL